MSALARTSASSTWRGLIADVVGYAGAIEHDLTKPDGTPRKLMSSAKLRSLGWEPKIGLREGLSATYDYYKSLELPTAAT